jgi:phospholipid/cholesterol/gamma-HCH transport system substrate-binding protein
MSKETGNYVRLGVFVLTGSAVLILGLYLLGSKRNLFSKSVTISATFHEVGGLRPGNNVRYAGINVGTVQAITIVNDTVVLVEMAIRTDQATHIRASAVASIGSDGLMGNKLVSIDAGPGDGAPIADGTALSSREALNTDLMMRTLERTNDNLAAITTDLAQLSRRLNDPDNVIGMLSDTSLALSLRQALYDLQASAGNAYALTAGVNSLVLGAQHGEGALGVLISDQGAEQDMRRMLGDLRMAADTLGIAIGRISDFSRSLDEGPGLAHAVLRDSVMANDVRRMISRLDTSTVLLNEDLKALQSNWFFRRYFKDQEKAARKELK